MFDWKGLLSNYKFWLAVVGLVTSGVLFYRGLITADQLAGALTALAVIVLGFVTYEHNRAIKGIKAVIQPPPTVKK